MHYLANVPGIEHFKKCSCLIISQNAMQVAYISILHCSLPVISLLTCCQKELLKACTCLYSQGARHSGILPPPPSVISTIWLMSQGLSTFWLRTPPPPSMSTFWLTSVRYAIDIRIAFLFYMGFVFPPQLYFYIRSKPVLHSNIEKGCNIKKPVVLAVF